MASRRIGVVLAGACCVLAASFARGADDFDTRTQSADRTLAFVEQMTQSIEDMRSDARSRGQAMRGSCIDVHLKAARDNREVARGIRKRWDAGKDNTEYLTRSTQRLMRLQVYAMVFENEARSCASADSIARSAPRTDLTVSGSLVAGGPRIAYVGRDLDSLGPPRLERPPLASPY